MVQGIQLFADESAFHPATDMTSNNYRLLSRASRAVVIASLGVAAFIGVASAQAPATNARTAAAKPATAKSRASSSFAAVRGPSVEGITEYTLPNGLKILLFPDQSKPTVTVNITYLVGSRHEGIGETGMAHLLEHLVFKGTPKHPDIPAELTAHGAQANGTTWYDRTNYFEVVSATDANLEWALRLEADRMVNSFIAKKDLESEFTVVRNEFEAGENSPFRVLWERTMATAYLWHGYGRSPIGSRSDIERVPIDKLQAFYRKHYQPDNAVLVVAGKFDEKKTLGLIERVFGPIPRPKRLLDNTYTVEPTQDGERIVELKRVGDTQMLMAGYHVPAGTHADFAALDVLATVLGDSPAGRLHKALVESKKASSVAALNFQLREPGIMLLYAEVRKESSLDSARVALVKTLDDVATVAPTAEEVDRARTSILKEIELSLNASDQVGIALSEWASIGDWRLLFLHRDRIRKVTPEDVKRVAAAYMKPSNRTLSMFIPTSTPDRAEIPTAPDVAFLVKDYKGDTIVTAGEAFEATPANIDARSVKATMPNGMRLTTLSKTTRGGTVRAMFQLRFGSEQAVTNKSTVSSLTAGMLDRGTTTRTRQQLKDSLDKLKARVSVGGSNISAVVNIETTRENLPAVLAIVNDMLRRPAFDAKEFEQLRQERLAQIEAGKSEPQVAAVVAYSRNQNPRPKGHPLYTPTIDEQIADTKAVTLEDVKKFYADFYGASDADLAIVGDFDSARITAQVTELFGSWKSPQPFTRISNPYRESPVAALTIETPDKTNAFFVAGLNVNLRDSDPDYAAMELANYIIGGGFLNSRLATRIRQKDGLSYGVGSQFGAHPIDNNGSFTAFAIYAPQNAEKLEAAFREEIERVLKDGFTADEVEKAKTGLLQGRQLERADDAQLVGELAGHRYFNRTFVFDAELDKKLASLTPEQLRDALRRHVDPKKITVVKAGDFAKAKAAAAAAQPKP
ncbi:MAG: M16 family metallopeptidase [Gemmatimonadaceae bacterium]